jgi:hypothetical protein
VPQHNSIGKERNETAAPTFILDPELRLMKRPATCFARLSYLALLTLACTFVASTTQADVFELRTYVTNEGKLDALNARFRNHTTKLFEKHGMVSVGYWVPSDGEASKNTLIYILRHKSREAAEASWKAFRADPEWQKVAKESQVDGEFLPKPPESVYMDATDYSPMK